jgi:hypothetical protein
MYNQGMSDTALLENSAPLNKLTELDKPTKVKLSVPLYIAYVKRGFTDSQIADICSITRQAVNDYKTRHYQELAPMIESDGYLAARCKSLALEAQERIMQHLDKSTPKDLIALNAISGTHIDKYAKLTGVAEIVDIRAVTCDLTDFIKQCQDKLAVDSEQPLNITPAPTSDDS